MKHIVILSIFFCACAPISPSVLKGCLVDSATMMAYDAVHLGDRLYDIKSKMGFTPSIESHDGIYSKLVYIQCKQLQFDLENDAVVNKRIF
jgi:hypothetical protein